MSLLALLLAAQAPFIAFPEPGLDDPAAFLLHATDRLGEDGLRRAFHPVLPSRITRLVLRNFSVRGRRYDIVVERDTLRFVAK